MNKLVVYIIKRMKREGTKNHYSWPNFKLKVVRDNSQCRVDCFNKPEKGVLYVSLGL